ncbi:MAG: cache domain-containing protein [Oligoflexia bacterium]|nr:cache domain-containing protein [Oligoflexia bacterium]
MSNFFNLTVVIAIMPILFLYTFFFDSVSAQINLQKCPDYSKTTDASIKSETLGKCAKLVFEKEGREKAFKNFNDPKGGFVEGEVYIWTLDTNGICLQHAVNHKLEGMVTNRVKDSKGKPFIAEILNLSQKQDAGRVEYSWTHPTSKKVADKITFFIKAKDDKGDVILLNGHYK